MDSDILKILLFVAALAIQAIAYVARLRKAKDNQNADTESDQGGQFDWDAILAEANTEADPNANDGDVAKTWLSADHDDVGVAPIDPKQQLEEQLQALIDTAEERARIARLDRATQPPARVLDDYVIGPAHAQLTALRALDRERPRRPAASADASADFIDGLDQDALFEGQVEQAIRRGQQLRTHLAFVSDTLDTFIQQRHIPELRQALGDADELARACYQPLFDFARVNQLELTSAEPIAVLTPFQLSTWTGFLPTGLAPLFLPSQFFDDIRWWPALAHEIGHDFLAATRFAEPRLRAELGLVSEDAGRPLLQVAPNGVTVHEVMRLFSVWFEEIFCDAIGTLMLGPAYGYTMVALFAQPGAPEHTVTVATDSYGMRYDHHPPRALRVALCAHLLELCDEHEAAEELRELWARQHGAQETLWVPTSRGDLGLPLPLMIEIGSDLLTSLYRDGKEGLDGHALADIPGLDYGPHAAAEARRAAEHLRAGRAPQRQQARSVIAGAVLAWHTEPERGPQYLALARQAIIGATEHKQDAYSQDLPAAPTAHPIGHSRDAFVLHTLLAPPPGLRHAQPRRRGFVARRSWP